MGQSVALRHRTLEASKVKHCENWLEENMGGNLMCSLDSLDSDLLLLPESWQVSRTAEQIEL